MSPPLRPRWHTGWHRAYEARARRTVADLARFAAVDDEARCRRALGRRLAALRTGLWEAPGWRARLASRGLSPNDLQGLDDLPAFPILRREQLAVSGHDLVARPEADGLVVMRSSGSTGAPVTVYRDTWETLHMWAVLRWWCARLQVDPGPRPRVVLLCSLPSGIATSRRVPLFGDGALHRIAISQGDAAERLRRLRPAVVFSDPAGLQWFATQPSLPTPRLMLSSAQHLWDGLRATLDAPVLNYYATTETGPVAWECLEARNRFHVLLPEVFVEGQAGELLVTRLRRSPWPLLRYATGDRGRVVRDVCRCGYRGWSIEDLHGRRRVEFTRPDGTAADAWQLAWVFKDAPLTAFRLTQVAPAAFVLELVGGDGPDVLPRLTWALRRCGWPEPRVEVRRVDGLVAGGDKPEPFVRAA